MEYRIKDYQVSGNSIVLPRETSIEDIRLIYNETQKVLICSTAKKDNLRGLGVIIVNQFNNTTTINVPTSICVLQPNDQLTIKCDYGDDLSSVESKVEEVGNKIDNIKLPEIDTTELAKEVTLNEVSNKLDNLNVEVDLSGVAKETTLETQGGKIDRILDIVDEKYATQIDEISALL
jgi:hypothetical protein